MKVVVCWEHPNEKGFAHRVAGMVRRFLANKHPNVQVDTAYADKYAPYRNDAEVLAAEAQRLLDAQEQAFGYNYGGGRFEINMSSWLPDGFRLWDKHFNEIKRGGSNVH